MKFKLAALLVGMVLIAAGSAQAQNPAYGNYGLKDRVDIPAPIPQGGAYAVPAGVPVPEGFTWYLRADLGWSFAGDRSYSENGRQYGTGPDPFTAAAPFGFGGGTTWSDSSSNDDVFIGTVGFGAYLTRHLRGDLTLDFRGKQSLDYGSTYSYVSDAVPNNTIDGTVQDHFQLRGVVGLANLYLDLLPRGWFTPYVGAGIGFIYNDLTRSYSSSEVEQDGGPLPLPTSPTVQGSSKEKGVALAAALMAGASFALNQSWSVDVNYRALYLGGIDIVTPINGVNSKVELGDTWEHQARIGLRYNIW